MDNKEKKDEQNIVFVEIPDEIAQELYGDTCSKPEIEIPVITNPTPPWPEEVMDGIAGKFALKYSEHLETPQNFLYIDFLTVFGNLISSKITLQSALTTQPRMYVINLGESAETRKSTSINQTISFFKDIASQDDFNINYGVGSAEGLAKSFEKSHRVLLVLDELKSLIQKMRIDGSVLMPCIGTLFEQNNYQNSIKKHDINIPIAELCLL